MKSFRSKNFVCLVFVLLCTFITGCAGINDGVLTEPEYIKEVIMRKSSFDDILDNFLDQVDTYNGTEESKKRLEDKGEQAIEFVNSLKNDLKDRVPEECKQHYENMMKAYATYLEGLAIYRENLPKDLSEERKEAIKSAEQKLHEASEAMMSL